MEDKEILRRILQGFKLIPAKFPLTYTTTTGKATPDLAKRINAWIQTELPHSPIRVAYDATHVILKFYKRMEEQLVMEYIIRHILMEEADKWKNLDITSFQGDHHADRTTTFVADIKAGTPIQLQNGDSIKVDKVQVVTIDDPTGTYYEKASPNQMKKLQKVLPLLNRGDQLYLWSGETKHSITAVSKTIELGGKGVGGSTKPEQKVVASLNEQINKLEKPINISFNGTIYPGITGVELVAGGRKADFFFTSTDKLKLYISYKHGSNTSGIISYGGITLVQDAPEVKKFIEEVQKQTTEMHKGSKEYGAEVLDMAVAEKVMFGSEFSAGGNYGFNNVQGVMQGSIELKPVGDSKDNIYSLACPKVIYSPDVPTDDLYKPFYNARYANDRNQFGIQHCRFNVIPKGSRKNAKVLNIHPEVEKD